MRTTPLLLLALAAPALAQPTAEDVEFFEKRIRPVLVEHCYSCHSHGAKKPKAGLFLDSRTAMLKGGDNGPALVPGDHKKSRLHHAVTYKDVDLQMPPRAKLPENVVSDLAKWIDRGAVWPDSKENRPAKTYEFDLAKRKAEHWAWQPIQNPAPPKVTNEAWPASPIDRFLLAKLEEKNLAPAPPAKLETLLRRLHFDITGLPPTPQELDAFLQSAIRNPQSAIEAAVDRLLASEDFGPRWARHWLDLMRYAESRGHEFDYTIPNAYQYRDYVIRALNADVPYDQFTREHLAGDLLPKPRLHPKYGWNESILGTGFWWLGEQVHSPVDICQDRADRQDNQIDVMTKAFLGLTVSCARCHDHKFDAISTKDYYALIGFLESSSYRLAPFETMEHNRKVAEKLWKLREEYRPKLQKAFAEAAEPAVKELLQSDAKFIASFESRLPRRQVLYPQDAMPIADYAAAGVESWSPDGFAFGPGPAHLGQVRFGSDVKNPVAFEAIGGAVVDAFWDSAKPTGSEAEPGALGKVGRPGQMLRSPKFELETGKVFVHMRGQGTVYAAVEGHVMINGPLHGRIVQPLKTSNNSDQWVSLDLRAYRGRRVHLEFTGSSNDFAVARIVQASASPEFQGNARPRDPRQELVALLAKLKAGRILTDSGDAELANQLLAHPALGEVVQKLRTIAEPYFAKVEKLKAEAKWGSRLAPAMLDGNGVNERVYIRGNYKTPGDVVERRLLEALVGPAGITTDKGSGRLQLAEQIVDPTINPFFTRVFVNRVWHHLFGKGIVASVDNFGVLGEPPSHPELLDFLASDFAADGYSLKKLIKKLVLTKAYQMSVTPDPKALAVDPDNRLLQHMRVRRLEGEAIRDAILAVSGRLDKTAFGPSVPVALNAFQDGRGKPASGPLDGNGRRSVYLAVRRNFLSSFLLAFDQPIPFSAVGRRSVSNVPAQALILLNDPFVHQQSELWAKNTLAEPGTSEQRIARMYRAAFNRVPSSEESTACAAFLDQQRMANVPEPRAWAGLAHVLINSKEFIYLE
jgi:hypothetical protein